MSGATFSSFERSLGELDVPATRIKREEFTNQVEEAVEPPAVGVPLGETFDEPALSLDGTPVTVDPTPVALREATTGVTGARLGIGDYGTLALSLTDRASELVSLFVEHHVAVVRERDLVDEMRTGIETLGEEFAETRGSAILATGPSATADMGALVKGAHGPRTVEVLVLTEDD
ncbi:LUD domain-containing protein [Haloarcula salina]|uniref:LUD domain-containing protein n=1 Tax=Haloarcula salina TaxID=1429914 RepID=A0AA41FZA9_9EURY|nr:LUD domain-containing protein [Haloarcula salina]MBV0901335.1 LUD domain-containing protein [Haloarcula salina]